MYFSVIHYDLGLVTNPWFQGSWGQHGDRQDPCGPHVGPMNLTIWDDLLLWFYAWNHLHFLRSVRLCHNFMNCFKQFHAHVGLCVSPSCQSGTAFCWPRCIPSSGDHYLLYYCVNKQLPPTISCLYHCTTSVWCLFHCTTAVWNKEK